MTLGFIIISAGIPASLQEAMEEAVATVLGRHLEQITNALDDIKTDINTLKGDVSLIARSTALVSFHSNFTR